ncbi:hypothetical protein [Bacillus atrophaeus]|uniref:hypothetical protein n=1 Tax=Bacillus atrophaeus TaxID=1452 RepID=UPI0007793069|nr:hypothetical protein [Bacillus atrophaeus]KYD05961.1 hypothetical protein B4144_3249 [Bacillus atrophaeus]
MGVNWKRKSEIEEVIKEIACSRQGFEPPWLHKYDCLAKAFEAFVFFVLKPSAVDKSQAV